MCQSGALEVMEALTAAALRTGTLTPHSTPRSTPRSSRQGQVTLVAYFVYNAVTERLLLSSITAVMYSSYINNFGGGMSWNTADVKVSSW